LVSLSDLIREKTIDARLLPFLKHSRFGMKLIAVNILQQKYNVLYSDSDVLALNSPEDIISNMCSGSKTPAFLYDEIGYPVDAWIKKRASEVQVEINANFNAGLVWLPRNAISQSLFASLLEKWDPKFDTYQTEQTLFSALVSSANGISLPVKTNVLSWQGVWFYEMIFRVQEFKQDTMLGQLGIECI
jgi:lipopolysaccharide biosynthesis glycosyltransferase